MTWYVCCDTCGVMSFADCAKKWGEVGDKHYCEKCAALPALPSGPEPKEFCGLPVRSHPHS